MRASFPEAPNFEWTTREKEVGTDPFSEEEVSKAIESLNSMNVQSGDGVYPESEKALHTVQ